MRRIFLCLLWIALVEPSNVESNEIKYVPITKAEKKKDTIPVLNRENLRKELIKRNIPHYEIVEAQAILETGHFTSKHCKERNNIFGMRNRKGYKYYNNWIECVDDYEQRFSKRYKSGDYFEFLRKCNYAEDKLYEQKVRKLIKL